jgi:hypothetical protein
VVGERALRHGRDELELLAEAGRRAPVTSEIIADFLRDLDDPRRATEINDAAAATTGRTSEEPGKADTMGYTGFEGLLNYAYYQTLGVNQFDRGGHSLHINLYEAFTGPCGAFSSGRDTATGEPGVPAKAGGTTTEYSEIADCATWLGPNQPGINQLTDLPKYHPSVCPDGTAPEHARINLCDPADPASAAQTRGAAAGAGTGSGAGEGGAAGPGLPDLPDLPDLPGSGGRSPRVNDLLDRLNRLPRGRGPGRGGGGSAPASRESVRDVLDYLFRP